MVSSQWNSDPSVNNAISTVANSAAALKSSPVAASDGNGGMFIAWEDDRNTASGTDIYIQKINANGSLAFAAGGIPVTTAADDQTNVSIISDSAGGVILVWQDARTTATTSLDIYGQRISSTGTALWTANGVLISNGGGTNFTQNTPLITMINLTEAIVVWRDSRGASADPYANKIAIATGATQWTSDVQLSNAASGQTNFGIIPDGANGAIIVWEDPSGNPPTTTDRDLFGQRLNNAGTKLWSPASAIGHMLVSVTGIQQTPSVTPDGAGGFVMVWADARSGTNGGNDIFAQRFDPTGAKMWGASDVKLVDATGFQSNPIVVNAGNSSFVFAWNDPRAGTADRNIYAQKTNATGALQWIPTGGVALDGLPVVTLAGHQPASSTQSGFQLLSDSTGGAFVIWDDARAPGTATNPDMYAQHILSNGTMAWDANGNVVSNALNGQKSPASVRSTDGSIIVGWSDSRSGAYHEIYASKVFANGLLPVDFIQISAAINRNDIAIKWLASCDSQTDRFEIEKSANGTSFKSIGTMKAPAVTVSCVIEQEFSDAQPLKGNNYYRIKGVDKDGKFSYSPIARIAFGGGKIATVQLYPNPAKDAVNIQMVNIAKGNYTIRVLDVSGKIIQSRMVNIQLPFQQQSIPLQGLQPGNYIITMVDENGVIAASRQLIKQ